LSFHPLLVAGRNRLFGARSDLQNYLSYRHLTRGWWNYWFS
jgi:hypothetical protein